MKRFFLSIISPLRSPLFILSIALFYYIFIYQDITGDLGRIGQIVFSKEYRLQEKFQKDSPSTINCCDEKNFKSFNVIFMGDSFTKLTLYPNYLSEMIKMPTAEFFSDNIETPEETFVALCNANIEMPKVVVLESVERDFVTRLCSLDFSSNIQAQASVYKTGTEKQTDFCTFYKNMLFDNGAVSHLFLHDSLFTCPKKEKDLFFYYCDLIIPDEEQINIAISKLDLLFQFARENGVYLFYVVAADKYDIYQDFASENIFSRKELLDFFIEYEYKNPFFVNTKTILVKKVMQGVKDLYYSDDTHWSPIGAKIVAEEIAWRMDSLGIIPNYCK
jgi:hypothetical protein